MGLVLLVWWLGDPAGGKDRPTSSLTFDTGPLKSRRTDQNIFFLSTRSNFDCLPTISPLFDYVVVVVGNWIYTKKSKIFKHSIEDRWWYDDRVSSPYLYGAAVAGCCAIKILNVDIAVVFLARGRHYYKRENWLIIPPHFSLITEIPNF